MSVLAATLWLPGVALCLEPETKPYGIALLVVYCAGFAALYIFACIKSR